MRLPERYNDHYNHVDDVNLAPKRRWDDLPANARLAR